MPDWIKHKLESRLQGEISITLDTQVIPLLAESKELKSLLMKVKEENENFGLKSNIQKTKIIASGPITSWQIDGETMETVTDLIFLASKITPDGDCSHEIKRHLLLGRKAMTSLDSILKSRDITLPTKVHLERLYFHFSLSCIGEGNGNPLQYSCLGNPMDRRTWWATVHGVAKESYMT